MENKFPTIMFYVITFFYQSLQITEHTYNIGMKMERCVAKLKFYVIFIALPTKI